MKELNFELSYKGKPAGFERHALCGDSVCILHSFDRKKWDRIDRLYIKHDNKSKIIN